MKWGLIVLFLISGLIAISVVSAVPDGGVAYYNFSDDTDYWNSNDGTATSLSSSSYYPVYNNSGNSSPSSYYWDADGDYFDAPKVTGLLNDSGTISLWFNATDLSGAQRLFDTQTSSYFNARVVNNDKLTVTYYYGSTNFVDYETAILATDEWYNLIITWDSSRFVVYLNGSVVSNQSSNGVLYTDGQDDGINIGSPRDNRIGYANWHWDGLIDEVKIYDYSLNKTEALNIFNYGNISGAVPPVVVNTSFFEVTVKDFWENTTVNNAWAFINSTNYSTTNGTIVTPIIDNSTSLWNITVGSTNHFNRYYENYNVSVDLTAYLNASAIKFSVFEYLTGTELSSNITIDGVTKTNNTYFGLSVGSHTAEVTKDGYYDRNFTIIVSGKDNKTINLSGLYNSIINITVNDSWTGNAINNFTINIYNSTLGLNLTNATTNGYLSYPVINSSYYTLKVTPDISKYNYDQKVVFSNNSLYNHTFLLYPYNSINISFKNLTAVLVTEQLNLTFINSLEAWTNQTSVGYINISLLAPDDYELRVVSENFTDRTIYFTVTNRSTQNLTVYLVPNVSTEYQVFQIIDTTNADVTGAILRVEKETPSGTTLFTNYAEQITNAEGKAVVYLEKGVFNYYRFSVLINGSPQQIYPSGDYVTSKTSFISGVTETTEIVIDTGLVDTNDYYQDLYGVVTSSGIIGNTTWFYWLDGQNTITGGKLVIKGKYLDNTTSYEVINTQTLNAATGNLTYAFTPINNTIYQAYGYIVYSSYDTLTETQTKTYNVSKNVNENVGLLYAAGILIVTALLTITFGVMLSAVLTVLMLVFTNLVGFTNFPVTVITSLIALIIILLVRITKNDEG